MSLAQDYHVHLGFWTDWSYGLVQGATVTLTRRNGGLLIAFIAIFIGATGKSFWRIACFLLHRRLSSPRPRDGIYHQVQAILRNSDSAQGAAWSLGQVSWAWKVSYAVRGPFVQLISITALALIVSAAFGLAGIFSSHVTTDTVNQVLLTGQNCGPLKSYDDVDPVAYATLFEPFQNQRVTTYANYALQCYERNMSSQDCRPFAKPKLKTTSLTNASCPFSSEICKSQSKNLIVDTGYMDSHTDFGINSAPGDRWQLRMVHHCAPILTSEHTAVYKENSSSEPIMRYYLGELNFGDDTPGNFTYEIPMNTSSIYHDYNTERARARADYEMNLIKAYGGPLELSQEFSMFNPIPQLRRADADTMLFFLSAPNIVYSEPNDDPWYSAHQPGPAKSNLLAVNSTVQTYLQDEPVSVLGCAMQMQFCNPNLPEETRCQKLRGTIDDSFDVTSLYKTQAQKIKMQWAVDIVRLSMFTISGIVDALGVTALTARYQLSNNIQGPLPDNQWQTEVEHWVGASLTSVQGAFVEAANGPPTATYQRFRRAPNETEQKEMCRNQKITSTQYSSFSVLGVGLIFVVGGLIMLTDFCIESLWDYLLERVFRRHQTLERRYARLEWEAGTTLQYQRLAHEQIGVGKWSPYAGWSHPTTAPHQKLAVFDVQNAEHPLLITPREWEYTTGPVRAETVSEAATSMDDMKRLDTGSSSVEKKGVKRADTFATLVDEKHGKMQEITVLDREISRATKDQSSTTKSPNV